MHPSASTNPEGLAHLRSHSSAKPGTGQGRALRAALIPKLLSAADDLGVDIVTTAASPTLADRYRADLVDEGRGWPRGRRLRRTSQPLKPTIE